MNNATKCAWCLDEIGAKSNPGDSNGICPRHREQLLDDYRRSLPGDDLARYHGHREDQARFSTYALIGAAMLLVALGLVVGSGMALWRAIQ